MDKNTNRPALMTREGHNLSILRAQYRGFQLDAAACGLPKEEFQLTVVVEISFEDGASPSDEIPTPEQWVAGAHRVALRLRQDSREAARALRAAMDEAERAVQNAADIEAEQDYAMQFARMYV